MQSFHAIVFVIAYLSLVDGDMYLHNPRGSNNRLNENTATRRNGNRVFDSQNNNRGGYNIGDLTDEKAGDNYQKQYRMHYIMSPVDASKGSSLLPIEWTNQHGCGANEDDDPTKCNCNIVLQMMCQEHPGDAVNPDQDMLRDGTKTDTNEYQKINDNENYQQFLQRKNSKVKIDRALHEPFEWYDKCTKRKRNHGLFIADQKLRGSTSQYTRQNNKGTRRGYECPEERDYFPYWHPTMWKDIKVLAEREDRCEFYQKHSFNVKSKWECVEKWSNGKVKHYSEHNNEKDCIAGNGVWTEFHNFLEILDFPEAECKQRNASSATFVGKLIWGRPLFQGDKKCLVRLDPPECEKMPFSRVNHLGNGVDLEPLQIKWKIPAFPSGKAQKCVLRIRYNISTDDYNVENTTLPERGATLITNNPTVNVGAIGQGLKLAINTAQFGRTFQDRSHVSILEKKDELFSGGNIITVSVRGKRGNIVQTFPAVEYDFIPTNLQMESNDAVYFTWTGSNSHNNGGGGGDGQAGDDGQGAKGTDRSNICSLRKRDQNYPLPSTDPDNLCMRIKKIVWSKFPVHPTDPHAAKLDACIQLMSSGFYKCLQKHAQCTKGYLLPQENEAMDALLNNAPATFQGMVLQLEDGAYHYFSTRNNEFTNRAQKASIFVGNTPAPGFTKTGKATISVKTA